MDLFNLMSVTHFLMADNQQSSVRQNICMKLYFQISLTKGMITKLTGASGDQRYKTLYTLAFRHFYSAAPML